MATWPWRVPAVRTLDSASDTEMAAVAASAGKKIQKRVQFSPWEPAAAASGAES